MVASRVTLPKMTNLILALVIANVFLKAGQIWVSGQWRVAEGFRSIGNEICVAKQDLVIAIDGSGSLRFKIVTNFAAELIDRYKGKYFSAPAMRIGEFC